MTPENFILDLATYKLKSIIHNKITYKWQPSNDEIKKFKHDNRADLLEEIKNNNGLLESYKGFDMTGFGTSIFDNLELLCKFKTYMDQSEKIILPTFWKGNTDLFSCPTHCFDDATDSGHWLSPYHSMGGATTKEILFKCITKTNPNILKNLVDELEQDICKDFTNDLDDLIDKDSNYKTSTVINNFKRDLSIITKMKKKYSKCQICGFTFKKKNGEPYNEIHHIIKLSDDGKDSEINILVVCANCHRQLHYANTDITNILKGKIIINGVVHTITA